MRKVLIAMILILAPLAAALAADAKAGQPVYEKACKSCHGADGTPNPAIAKMMKIEIKDLKSSDVQSLSNDDMKKIISEGKGKMKPVRTVTGGSIDDVAAYVHTLKR